MSQKPYNQEPLDRLLGDVLSSDDVSPEQLLIFAEHPERLSADERSHIDTCLAESPALRDQLRVLQGFTPPIADAAMKTFGAKHETRWLQRIIDQIDELFGRMLVPVGALVIVGLSLAVLVMFEQQPPQPVNLAEQQTEQTVPDAQIDASPAVPESAPLPTEQNPPSQLAKNIGKPQNVTPPEPENTQQQPDPMLMLAMIDPVYVSPYENTTDVVVRGAEQTLRILAPNMANTASNQPTLYWRLRQQPSRGMLLSFELSDDASGELITSKAIPIPEQAGLQNIDLKQLDVKLTPNRVYQWSILLQQDANNPALDRFASAKISFVKPTIRFLGNVDKANEGERASLYAQQGYWYDALANMVQLKNKYPARDDVIDGYRHLLQQIDIEAP